MKLTSLKLSKLLYEKGFRGDATYYWEYQQSEELDTGSGVPSGLYISDCWYISEGMETDEGIPAYDLLWDICIKYGKELFGEEMVEFTYSKGLPGLLMFRRRAVTLSIVSALSDNKQEEAEQYIINNLII
jgi:hypothetical protein